MFYRNLIIYIGLKMYNVDEMIRYYNTETKEGYFEWKNILRKQWN